MKRRLWALLLAMVLVFTSCGGSEDKPLEDSEEEVETEEELGEQEKDAVQHADTYWVEEPTTLNSAKGSDTSSFKVLTNIMEPLARNIEHEDGSLELEPAAAESWEVSEDGLTYTFHLRDNLWSDGEPVTAKDYEFGIKMALDSEHGTGGMGYLLDCIRGAKESMAGEMSSDEIGVSSPDDKTLVVELEQPASYFLQLVTTRGMLPIRQDKFEAEGEKYGSGAETILTNGPFKLDSWTHQSDLQLSKHEDYWDQEKVSLETIDWRILSDNNTRMNAFANKELDWVTTDETEWQERFEAMEDVEHKSYARPLASYMFFNTKKAPYNNAKVRLAISLALNREEAIDAVANGNGEPAYGWVMPMIQLDGKEYREVVAGPLEAMKDEYDPKELFAEGLKEEGIEDPASFTINLQFGGTDARMKEMGDYYLETVQDTLGCQVEVGLNEWAAYSSSVQAGNFEVGYMGWTADYNDPYGLLSLNLTTANALSTGWSNEEYDALVTEAAGTEDVDKKFDLYEQAETILMKESPVVPVFYRVADTYNFTYYKGMSYSDFATQGLKYAYTAGK